MPQDIYKCEEDAAGCVYIYKNDEHTGISGNSDSIRAIEYLVIELNTLAFRLHSSEGKVRLLENQKVALEMAVSGWKRRWEEVCDRS